jgi:hypothetical protein
MAFPISPSNNQQATVNGIVYVYSTATSAWTRLAQTIVPNSTGSSLVSGTWTFSLSTSGIVTLNGTVFSSGGSTVASGTGTTTTFVISNVTASTGTNSGALQVAGGVGVGGNINVRGTITGSASAGLTLLTTDISTNTQVAAINITAGAINSVGTTPGGSINITSGAGLGTSNAGGSVNITGGDSNDSGVAGSVNISGGASSNGPGSVNITHGGGYGSSSGSINIGAVLPLNKGGDVNIQAGDVANSSQIKLVGANGNMFVTGANITMVSTATTGTINNMSIGAITAATGRFTTATIISSAASTSTTTGALTVAGGVGISGNLNVGGSISVSGVFTATNVYVNGYAVSTSTGTTIQSAGSFLGPATTLNFSTGTVVSLNNNVLTIQSQLVGFNTNIQSPAAGQTIVYSTSTSNWQNRNRIFKSSTAPSSPQEGDIWVDTSVGGFYMYLVDGGGVAGVGWVQITS